MFHITIHEQGDQVGYGMPYGPDGAADKFITKVSGNEIPELVTCVVDWIRLLLKIPLINTELTQSIQLLQGVAPLLFGQSLCEQLKLLLVMFKNKALNKGVLPDTGVEFSNVSCNFTSDGDNLLSLTNTSTPNR